MFQLESTRKMFEKCFKIKLESMGNGVIQSEKRTREGIVEGNPSRKMELLDWYITWEKVEMLGRSKRRRGRNQI